MKTTILTTLIILICLGGFTQNINLSGYTGNGYYSGRLGIGITAPAYKLDIVATNGPRLRVFSQDGYFAGMLAKNNTHEYFVGVQGIWEASGGTNSGFHIYDNTVGAQRMVIDAAGNMGVGTTAPGARLHVGGTFKLTDGSEGDGKVLTSNASGLATWSNQPMSNATVEAIKELHAEVEMLHMENDWLRAQINTMNECIQSLCRDQSKSVGVVEINENMLFQNQPNPFDRLTVIRYHLAENTKSREINVRDLNGRIIKSFEINQPGAGEFTLNANELANGTYTCTLMVNNESIDTRLMVVAR